jgi:hypothetical protein
MTKINSGEHAHALKTARDIYVKAIPKHCRDESISAVIKHLVLVEPNDSSISFPTG